MCVCWIGYAHRYVQVHAPDSVHYLSLPLSALFLCGRMVSCWTWTVHFSSRLAVSMLQWSFCVCPRRAGITSMCKTTRAFFFFLFPFFSTWALGSLLWSSWLHGRSSWPLGSQPLQPFHFLFPVSWYMEAFNPDKSHSSIHFSSVLCAFDVMSSKPQPIKNH